MNSSAGSLYWNVSTRQLRLFRPRQTVEFTGVSQRLRTTYPLCVSPGQSRATWPPSLEVMEKTFHRLIDGDPLRADEHVVLALHDGSSQRRPLKRCRECLGTAGQMPCDDRICSRPGPYPRGVDCRLESLHIERLQLPANLCGQRLDDRGPVGGMGVISPAGESQQRRRMQTGPCDARSGAVVFQPEVGQKHFLRQPQSFGANARTVEIKADALPERIAIREVHEAHAHRQN